MTLFKAACVSRNMYKNDENTNEMVGFPAIEEESMQRILNRAL